MAKKKGVPLPAAGRDEEEDGGSNVVQVNSDDDDDDDDDDNNEEKEHESNTKAGDAEGAAPENEGKSKTPTLFIRQPFIKFRIMGNSKSWLCPTTIY
jgi:hypothetical protein